MSFLIKIMNNFKNQGVPSLMININNKKYLINAPELVQRFFRENGVKLATITNTDSEHTSREGIKIFITGNQNEHIAGLFGLMCSLNEKQFAEGTKIYCPDNIFSFILDNKYVFGFSFLLFSLVSLGSPYNITSHTYGITKQNKIEFGHNRESFLKMFYEWNSFCENLDIANFKKLNNALATVKGKSDYFTQEEIDYYNLDVIKDDGCEIIVIKIYDSDSKFYMLNYLFISPQIKNRLDKAKLEAWGLKGKEVGDLLRKGSIIKDGATISMNDVKYPDEKGTGLLILDLQEPAFVESFKQNPFWTHIQKSDQLFDFAYVVHCHGRSIIEHEQGSYFKQIFTKPDLEHIFVHEHFDTEYQIDTFKIKQKSREYFNFINQHFPFVFPKIDQTLYNNTALLDKLGLRHNLYQSYHEIMIAKKHVIKQLEYNQQKNESLAKLLTEPKSLSSPLYAKHKLLISTKNELKAFPFFIVLGTGSMAPSIYRNVSSILYAINENCVGLLDCGEGTYRQLSEQFGDKLNELLFKLKFILITHLHGDHVFGIYNIITERQKLLKKMNSTDILYIVVPENVIPTILSHLKNMEEANVIIISTKKLMETFRPNDTNLLSSLKAFGALNTSEKFYLNYENIELELALKFYYDNHLSAQNMNEFLKFLKHNEIKEILPVPVDHCPEACGFVITTATKKAVYSGDCRMTQQLADYGKDADVLIHESTFDCSVPIEEVRFKGHSNIEHAIRIAIKMNTQSLCLTHFSQRYSVSSQEEWDQITLPKNPKLIDYFHKNTFLAQDHMYFDFNILPLMPELHKLFNNYTYI